RYVDLANADVSRAESVRKFAVLPVQLTQDNGCLTPSLKVVRPKVNEAFKEVINGDVYAGKQ
ncbi:MAG: long-chain fatty acid--CoA ligase, partial [Bifidobacterium castoris]|nr:long-chain fatty acid--CoA ligase [Bifidobacterium castoris]